MTSLALRYFVPGRMFVSPAFDYLLIGGGLSLIVGLVAYANGLGFTRHGIPLILLLGNFAHFAASTVRLYTKPSAVKAWPFLTLGLPFVTLAAFTALLIAGETAVKLLFALFLVWSPFHYSAQTYGLSVMYAMRSGVTLGDVDKRLLRLACLLPFFWAVLRPQGGFGMALRHLGYVDFPVLEQMRVSVSGALSTLSLATPLLVFAWLATSKRVRLPAISFMIIATNAIWWTLFNYINAFFWASVFHGVQYLAIATYFHVRDRERRPENRRGWIYHSSVFYGLSIVLAYVLFVLWPNFYESFGFEHRLTAEAVVATINVHHFIVDAYIWKLRKDPGNRTVVDVPVPVTA